MKHITSEVAAEHGRKGGSCETPSKSFSKIKYCTELCPYYGKCPAISISHTIRKVKGKFPCFYKTCTAEVRESVKNLFEDGEQGMLNEIMKETVALIYNHKIDKYDQFKILEMLLNIKKSIYGDKQKIEHSGNMKIDAKISIAERIREYEKYYEELDGTTIKQA